MADEALLPPVASNKIVTQHTVNDVLLGRGPGLTKYVGNIQFRAIVDQRKDEYVATHKRKDKKRIAQEIVSLVHSKGGRFLKQVDDVDNCHGWYEVDDDTALEKTKQSLREQRMLPVTISPEESSHDVPCGGDATRLSSEQASVVFMSPSSTSCAPPVVVDNLPESPLSQVQGMEVETRKDQAQAMDPSLSSSPTTFAAVSQGGQQPEKLDTSTYKPLAGSFATVTPTLVQSTLPAHSSAIDAVPQANIGPAMMQPSSSVSTSQPTNVDPRLLLFRDLCLDSRQQSMIVQSFLVDQVVRSQLLERSLRNTTTETDRFPQCPLQSASVAVAASDQHYRAENAVQTSTSGHFHSDQQSQETSTRVATCSVTKSLLEDSMDVGIGERGQRTSSVSSSALPELMRASSSSTERRTSDRSIDEELSAFLLSSLALKDRPVITTEQEALERSMMTDEEKAALLSDLFGRMREQDVPQRKRARLDLDRTSIDFLVQQMRVELRNIPPNRKLAFAEAQVKCRPEEFSNSRLETFLRCVGMNTKLAAERFVDYWESRREVFGSEKFAMRMTLSEALQDDMVALSKGLYTILPHPDLSGRLVMYMRPSLHSREGYSSESMLRAIWYVAEVAAQVNTDFGGGVVNVVWFRGTTLWDYDIKVFDRWAYLLSNCWPIKLIANHLCCPTMTIVRVIKPIVHTFVNREFRSRTIEHDVADYNIVSSLSKYGISREILPSEMGGSVLLDQNEWIASRRAAELEEIN